MNMKYVEKLIILIVLFVGVTMATGGIIGTYVKTTKQNTTQNDYNGIILENINLSL